MTDDKTKQPTMPADEGRASSSVSKNQGRGQGTRRRRSSAKATEPKTIAAAQAAPKQAGGKQRQGSSKAKDATKSAAAETAAPATQNGRGRRSGNGSNKSPVKIIPLGGLNEIGKNMTIIEYQNDIIIVDCGMAFPDDDMLGIDLVLPDYTYLEKNKDRIRGIVLTHGHEDHIGGLPFFLKEFRVPVYGTKLTLGLVEGKLQEAGILRQAKLHVVKAGDTIPFGSMSVEFINVNHSIPDACALAIFTPVGTLVHTGDFKIDYTPIMGEMIDLARFGELGKRGVLALMSDSTNAERAGSTPSERMVGESLEMLFKRAEGKRIIVATFSSNVHRVQQIINTAARYGRKVVVSGRSMENVVAKASELGYLSIPRNTLVEIEQMRRIPDSQMVLITTGSQGEPMSALSRMAVGEHRKVSVTPNDYIIISATPIPGNEKTVTKVINDLMRLGADVMYERSLGIHVSGHGAQDDIKAIIGLTRPKYFVPVHGEYKHLFKAADLAVDMGIPEANTIVGEIGRVIELTQKEIKMVSSVPSGSIMVDGSGVGDVGSVVLRDRKLLSEEGLIIVVAAIDKKTGKILSGPEIISRGFVYVRESEVLMEQIRGVCVKAITGGTGVREWANVKQQVRDQLGQFLFSKTKRRPLVLPIIQEINT